MTREKQDINQIPPQFRRLDLIAILIEGEKDVCGAAHFDGDTLYLATNDSSPSDRVKNTVKYLRECEILADELFKELDEKKPSDIQDDVTQIDDFSKFLSPDQQQKLTKSKAEYLNKLIQDNKKSKNHSLSSNSESESAIEAPTKYDLAECLDKLANSIIASRCFPESRVTLLPGFIDAIHNDKIRFIDGNGGEYGFDENGQTSKINERDFIFDEEYDYFPKENTKYIKVTDESDSAEEKESGITSDEVDSEGSREKETSSESNVSPNEVIKTTSKFWGDSSSDDSDSEELAPVSQYSSPESIIRDDSPSSSNKTEIHAEMKILEKILANKSYKPNTDSYVGISKKCCVHCENVIRSVNKIIVNSTIKVRDVEGHGITYPADVPNFLERDSNTLDQKTRMAIVKDFLSKYDGISNLQQAFSINNSNDFENRKDLSKVTKSATPKKIKREFPVDLEPNQLGFSPERQKMGNSRTFITPLLNRLTTQRTQNMEEANSSSPEKARRILPNQPGPLSLSSLDKTKRAHPYSSSTDINDGLEKELFGEELEFFQPLKK